MRVLSICIVMLSFFSCTNSQVEKELEQNNDISREIDSVVSDIDSTSNIILIDSVINADIIIEIDTLIKKKNEVSIIEEEENQHESILTKKERASLKTYNSLADPELIELYNGFDVENMSYPGGIVEQMISSVGYTSGVMGKLKDSNPKVDYLIMPSYYNNLDAWALNCVSVNEHYEFIEYVVFYEHYKYEGELYKTSVSKKDNTIYILTTEVEQKTETYELKFLENGYFNESKKSK